jgi:WD40 repeat protein
VATGDISGVIKLWDVTTRQELYTLAALGSRIRVVTFSPDGQDLIAGSQVTANGQMLHIWSTRPISPARPR